MKINIESMIFNTLVVLGSKIYKKKERNQYPKLRRWFQDTSEECHETRQ
ncbi:MAG: hypothetical protein ACTSWR_00150 [Candidatus Helarchaeota archaeon]